MKNFDINLAYFSSFATFTLFFILLFSSIEDYHDEKNNDDEKNISIIVIMILNGEMLKKETLLRFSGKKTEI